VTSVEISYTDAKKLPFRSEKPLIPKDFWPGFAYCLKQPADLQNPKAGNNIARAAA
jgi:hypothetical protein